MRYVGVVDGSPFIAVETDGNSIDLKISFHGTWSGASFDIGLDIAQAKELIRHLKVACETFAADSPADGRER